MIKFKTSEKGYTLIELLTVMIILIAVGAVIASILVSSLRGGNKSTTTNEIRQSGNYAMAQMSKMITYAKSFDGVSVDNNTWNPNCIPSIVKGKVVPPSKMKYIKITSFDDDQTIFSCSDTDNTLSSNSAVLINPTAMYATCYFICSQSDLVTPPTVEIHLTLKMRPQTGKALLPEFQTEIPFDTSVTIRNSR